MWRPENPYFVQITSSDEQVKRALAWQEGADAMYSALIKYLNEPCTEHPYNKIRMLFHKHRYQCPKCMAKLLGSKI